MRNELKLCLTALMVECGAISLLASRDYDVSLFISILLLHVSACCLALPLAWADKEESPWRRRHMFMSLSLVFLVPGIGILAVLAAFALVNRRPGRAGASRFLYRVGQPAYQPFRKSDELATRAGGLREHLLGEGKSPLEFRMKSLLGLQNVSPRFSSPVLRQVLGDSCDDLRLLAYGMLDSKEKQIARKIESATKRYRKYKAQHAPEDHYRAAKELSELHWELVYQQLVSGDVRKHAIEQAQDYAIEALKGEVQDSDLRFFLGRMRLLTGDLGGAAGAFEAALALGFPEDRAAPYLAEFCYLKGDYAAVRQMVSRAGGMNGLPSSRQIAGFWGMESHESLELAHEHSPS